MPTPIASTDILTALFTLLQGAAAWADSGQRLKFWTDVPNQPALYTRWRHDDYPPYEVRGAPPKITMAVEAWIFGKQPDVKAETSAVLGPLVDAVRAILRPQGARIVQDLGMPGIVSHCWIEGRVDYDTGDHSGQVVAIIPIRILVIGILG